MAYVSDTMSSYQRLLNLPLDRSFFLFGPRGTGKSTLLEQWRHGALASKVEPAQILWIDLLDPDDEAEFGHHPERLKERVLAAKPAIKWVVIDEVQKSPALLDVAHWLIEKKKIRFAFSGSSARKIKRGAGNLLAGRAFSFALGPLTHQELGADFDLDAALRWGTLPGLFALQNDLERRRFLSSYVQTYLREEIQLEQIVRNVNRFRQFLPLAAQLHGEPLQFTKTSSLSGVDEKSVARYFEILDDTLLGFFLEPFERSVRKRQSQKPKFFLFDLGVKNAIQGVLDQPARAGSSEYGRDFEAWVVTEVQRLNKAFEKDYRLSFLRTKDGAEIDLIVDRGRGAPLLIEIKSTEAPVEADERHLVSIGKELAKSPKIILCRARHARMTERGVEILPWKTAFERIFE
jgi:predicted AAA+ superfamily ATPase